MRVAFVVAPSEPPGPAAVLAGHAERLRADHDIDAQVISPAGAAAERFDVAIATWWETAQNLEAVAADRHAYFVQSMDDRLYRDDAALRDAAAQTHVTSLPKIAGAAWIARLLGQLTPAVAVYAVTAGVDKATFASLAEPASGDGPLRVLVVGDPAAWTDGVGAALAACAQAGEPRHVTLVDPTGAGAPVAGADVVLGPLSAAQLAGVCARTDVVLTCARIAAPPTPVLLGFHLGATALSTPVTGYDEVIEDGVNALLTSWDDERGTARLLDLLARDRALLARLRRGALDTAQAWPSLEQSSAQLARALEQIVAEPAVA